MKSILSAVASGSFALSALAQPHATVMPILVKAPVERVFVPVGFDDNDNAEVVIHGHFSNSCFKVGPATAKVDEATQQISIVARAWRYADLQCTQMLVPFTQSIKLGTLKKGTYKVFVEGLETLPVDALGVVAAPGVQADDYLYAPVEQVETIRNDDGTFALRLSGTFPKIDGKCMRLGEVKHSVVGTGVLIVQPITELLTTTNEMCDTSATRQFATVVPVGVLPKGFLLVHVRVLNGESLNRVVEVE